MQFTAAPKVCIGEEGGQGGESEGGEKEGRKRE